MKGRETPFSRAVGRYANPTAGKLTLAKAVFVYMFGGGLGTLWEVIFNVFYQIANDYTIRYIDCRGSLFTYFNPVYGCGALVIVFFLKKYSRQAPAAAPPSGGISSSNSFAIQYSAAK